MASIVDCCMSTFYVGFFADVTVDWCLDMTPRRCCLYQTYCSVHAEQERAACIDIPADNIRSSSALKGEEMGDGGGVQISLERSQNSCR